MNDKIQEHHKAENNKLNIAIQLVIPLFFILIFFKQYGKEENSSLKLWCTSGYILLGVLMTFFYLFKLKKNSLNFLLILLLLFLSFTVSLFSKNYRMEDSILVFTYFGIALIPMFVTLHVGLFKAFNYILIVFFTFSIIKGYDPNEMFSVSRNFISVLLLIGIGYHIISCHQNDKKPSLLLFILSLIVAIWAIGRAGIFTFSLLLASYPFIIKVKFGYKLVLVLLALFLTALAVLNFSEYNFEYGLGRFQDMGLDSERNRVNTDYINATFDSAHNLLWGCELSKISVISELDDNPHNSFIRLHVFYGLFGFTVLLISIAYAFKRLHEQKAYLYFVLLLALLLRIFLDSVAFHGPLDTLIYYLLFYSLDKIKIKL